MGGDIDNAFEEHQRRFDDKIKECREDVDREMDTIAQSITKMQADIQAMKEILEAWNNMKGFASGMRFISTTIKIVAPIVAFIGAFYWFSKTGNWPNGK